MWYNKENKVDGSYLVESPPRSHIFELNRNKNMMNRRMEASMNIISQPGERVNIISGNIPKIIQTAVLDEGEKWEMHKLRIPDVAAKLARIGQPGRAYRMEHCAEMLVYQWCKNCGRKHIITAQLCRDRFCPVCGWRLSLKRFATMVDIVQGLRREHPDATWQFVTLTCENCPVNELRSTMSEMLGAWDKIMRRRTTIAKVIGWARSLEITFNAEKRTLHPHFHVLLLWKEGLRPDNFLESAWMETVRLRTAPAAQHSDVIEPLRAATEHGPDSADEVTGAVLETFKYSVKSKDLNEMPLYLFRELDQALRGRRMVAFGGKVKEYARLLDAERTIEEPEDDTADDEEMARCAACGSVKLIQIVGAWTGDGYLWRKAAQG